MIIKGAMICDAKNEHKGDVRILNGKISNIARSILPKPNESVLEAEGLLLMPCAIDLNTRVKNSQLTKENLLTLSKKAANGGIGLSVLMPECEPSLSTEAGIELLNTLKDNLQAKILGACGSLGYKADGSAKINDLSILKKKGACAIYTRSSEDGNIIKRACEFSLMLDIPLFFHCEDEALSGNGAMNDGELSAKLGLPSISTLSETKEVAMLSEVSCFMQTQCIFQAIASDRSIEILCQAKKRNPSIFIQIPIHHLMLTEDLCNDYNTAAKIKPPLKSEQTKIKLQKRVKNLEIDMLTSLQCAHSLSKKDLSFEEAEFGVDMIEYYMPMCYTLLIKELRLTPKEASQILSYNPAKALKLKTKGLIEEGFDADLVLLNPKETITINDKNSPYYDSIFHGKIKQVFVDGKACL